MIAAINRIMVALVLWLALTGFDTQNAIVSQGEIMAGGPPKDGIPAILEPRFESAKSAKHVQPDDQVIGVVVGKEARAYPIKILNWHEAVNDTVSRQPLVVTF